MKLMKGLTNMKGRDHLKKCIFLGFKQYMVLKKLLRWMLILQIRRKKGPLRIFQKLTILV